MSISILGCCAYVISGVLQPVIIDWLRLHRALGRHILLLPTLANAVSMAATGGLASRADWQHFLRLHLSSSHKRRLRRRLLLTAWIDLCSSMLLAAGILWTGGSVFCVLYNSVPVWTLLQSQVCLKRHVTTRQVTGVTLVSIGLASTVVGSHVHAVVVTTKTTTTAASTNTSSTKLTLGSAMVLLGSCLQATMFILTEAALNTHKAPTTTTTTTTTTTQTTTTTTSLSSKVWCSLVGSLEACFMITWVGLHVLGGGFFFLDDSSSSNNNHINNLPTTTTIVMGFLSLCLVNTIHAASFFGLLQQLGAAGSSLLRGLQTVVVVLVSALLFCSDAEHAQCLTTTKSCSLVLVLMGMYIYSSSSSSSGSSNGGGGNKKHTEKNQVEHHLP